MRRALPFLGLLLLLSACGDDGKTAPRGQPAAPPTGMPSTPSPTSTQPQGPVSSPSPSPSPAPPPASGGSLASPWSTTRVGDSATWEIRVVGGESVTKLTWRATSVDASGVRYAVEARTIDVQGATKSLVQSEEIHAPTPDARGAGVAETLDIPGRSIATTRSKRPDGKTTVWTSDEVPFSGLVKSANGDVEQVLVAFRRGPDGR